MKFDSLFCSLSLSLSLFRGYGETDKPAGVRNYTIEILKEDIVQLVSYCYHYVNIIMSHY